MDKALKQRLVGAIVLIALAVIVLPMIFGGRPSSDGPGPSEIEISSPPPDLEFETRRFPVGEQPGSPPTSEPVEQDDTHGDQPVVAPPSATPQPQVSVESPVTEEPEQVPTAEQDPSAVEEELPVEIQTDEAPAAQTPAPVEPDASSLRYVVQVASFGSIENATRLAGQLEAAGYAVLLDNVSSDTAQLNRVRVGPYATETNAQDVVRELREEFEGVNPRIVDLQPDEATPVIANEDPLVRWVVQVGSFSSAENAENLVARLRLSGHSSYDETITNDTSTIYRVRVGPFLDRDEAIRVEQQIRADMGIEGVVMSAD